jgi:hypothetical protein
MPEFIKKHEWLSGTYSSHPPTWVNGRLGEAGREVGGAPECGAGEDCGIGGQARLELWQ